MKYTLPRPGTLRRLGPKHYATYKHHIIQFEDGWWYIKDDLGRRYDMAKQVRNLRERYA